MEHKQVKRYSLSQQVADRLEQMIMRGDYPVGTRIPTEPELMDMFSVSRNTLREAVRTLTSCGILDVRQGDGTYVRSNNRFHANMSMEYDQVSLDDIRETRNALEIAIARLAAMHRSDEDLSQLRLALIKRREAKESSVDNMLADIDFHLAVARSCHNKILNDLYLSISSYLRSHIAERQADTTMDRNEIDQLHVKLYLAIRDQSADQAGTCAKNILNI